MKTPLPPNRSDQGNDNGNGRHKSQGNGHQTQLKRPGGHSSDTGRGGYTLITGGAGFIGTNLAHRLLREGRRVLLLDSLARSGVKRNIDWLRQMHGEQAQFQQCDIRDAAAVREAVREADQVFHFAGQVAVTTSLTQPTLDFEVNARGTLNLLEALRACDAPPPPLVFTSTNKVYGGMGDISLRERATRYEPEDPELRAHGVSEQRGLNFHSPYGCSKGTADQYVLDYARTFNLPAVVFRMSCIYGPHQMGTEDQGWVAHFLISARRGKSLTIYGDGKQVRDVLFVEDLVEAFLLAQHHMNKLSGEAFNVGGGPINTLSLRELVTQIAAIQGQPPQVNYRPWRRADQRYYVSDTRAFSRITGWQPRVDVRTGVGRLLAWLAEFHKQAAVQTDASAFAERHGWAGALDERPLTESTRLE